MSQFPRKRTRPAHLRIMNVPIPGAPVPGLGRLRANHDAHFHRRIVNVPFRRGDPNYECPNSGEAVDRSPCGVIGARAADCGDLEKTAAGDSRHPSSRQGEEAPIARTRTTRLAHLCPGGS